MAGERTEQIEKAERSTEEIHLHEADLQQAINAAAAPAAPVEIEQVADPLVTHIHRLQDEEFQELNMSLVQADPILTQQDSNLFRQRQKSGGGKLGRRYAAWKQGKADLERRRAVGQRIIALSDNSKPDNIVQRSILEAEIGCYGDIQKLKEQRTDTNGAIRRKNEARYAKKSAVTPEDHFGAEEDADNLVENLRRDICLEGKTKVPDNMLEYTDAFYFVSKFGNDIGKEVTIDLKKRKEAGTITDEEYAAKKLKLKKLEQYLMTQKSYGSNFTAAILVKAGDIRARRLAVQQIRNEGDSPYHQEMIQYLEQEIAILEAKYRDLEHWMATYNETMDTPRSQAQAEMQRRLAQLRRQMKALPPLPPLPEEKEDDKKKSKKPLTPEEEAQKQAERAAIEAKRAPILAEIARLEKEGRDLLATFDYPGELCEYEQKGLGET